MIIQIYWQPYSIKVLAYERRLIKLRLTWRGYILLFVSVMQSPPLCVQSMTNSTDTGVIARATSQLKRFGAMADSEAFVDR